MTGLLWSALAAQAILSQQALNPNLSWVGSVVYSGGLTPDTFWMTHPSLEGEMVLQAPVDPYLDGWAVLSFSGEGAGVEEAYARTRSRWKGFLFRFGKFRSTFGRLNERHPHQRFFTTFPPSLASLFSEEGLMGTGVRADFLLPMPFFALLEGEVLGKTWMVGSGTASLDVGRWTHLVGVSVAWHRYPSRWSVVGGEWTARYDLSPYTFIVFQGEAFVRSKEVGGYVQGIYRFSRRQEVGMRVDHTGESVSMAAVYTLDPSEFSRFRLELGHETGTRSLSVSLNVQYALGPHGAHTF